MLTGQKSLAKVSGTPGKTTTINHFTIKSRNKDMEESQWYLVDLPGYGYAKRSKSQREAWEKMISEYLNKRENLITVFVLIDSRHEPQTADMAFIDKLGQWEVPFNLVFTKTDKSTQRITAANIKSFVMKMKEDWEFIPQKFQTSVVKGTGRKEILSFIEEMNENVLRSDQEQE